MKPHEADASCETNRSDGQSESSSNLDLKSGRFTTTAVMRCDDVQRNSCQKSNISKRKGGPRSRERKNDKTTTIT